MNDSIFVHQRISLSMRHIVNSNDSLPETIEKQNEERVSGVVHRIRQKGCDSLAFL